MRHHRSTTRSEYPLSSRSSRRQHPLRPSAHLEDEVGGQSALVSPPSNPPPDGQHFRRRPRPSSLRVDLLLEKDKPSPAASPLFASRQSKTSFPVVGSHFVDRFRDQVSEARINSTTTLVDWMEQRERHLLEEWEAECRSLQFIGGAAAVAPQVMSHPPEAAQSFKQQLRNDEVFTRRLLRKEEVAMRAVILILEEEDHAWIRRIRLRSKRHLQQLLVSTRQEGEEEESRSRSDLNHRQHSVFSVVPVPVGHSSFTPSLEVADDENFCGLARAEALRLLRTFNDNNNASGAGVLVSRQHDVQNQPHGSCDSWAFTDVPTIKKEALVLEVTLSDEMKRRMLSSSSSFSPLARTVESATPTDQSLKLIARGGEEEKAQEGTRKSLTEDQKALLDALDITLCLETCPDKERSSPSFSTINKQHLSVYLAPKAGGGSITQGATRRNVQHQRAIYTQSLSEDLNVSIYVDRRCNALLGAQRQVLMSGLGLQFLRLLRSHVGKVSCLKNAGGNRRGQEEGEVMMIEPRIPSSCDWSEVLYQANNAPCEDQPGTPSSSFVVVDEAIERDNTTARRSLSNDANQPCFLDPLAAL